MTTYTPADLTELILCAGERLLARKHGRPAPVWPRTAAVVESEGRYARGSAEDCAAPDRPESLRLQAEARAEGKLVALMLRHVPGSAEDCAEMQAKQEGEANDA